jgi:hypothetical protein
MSEDGSERTDNYLRFAHENIGCIVDGYEDATIRVGLDRDIQTGDRVELRSPKNRVFAVADVKEVYETRVGNALFDTVFSDGRNHPASNADDLLDRLRKHYDDDVMFDTDATVVYFDVLRLCTPRELHTGNEHDELNVDKLETDLPDHYGENDGF